MIWVFAFLQDRGVFSRDTSRGVKFITMDICFGGGVGGDTCVGADRNDYDHIVYFVYILGSLYRRRETWTAPSVWLAADHLEVSLLFGVKC